jgi:hypothetical protein
VDRAELHLPNQVFRKIDRGFHDPSFPAFQLSSSLSNSGSATPGKHVRDKKVNTLKLEGEGSSAEPLPRPPAQRADLRQPRATAWVSTDKDLESPAGATSGPFGGEMTWAPVDVEEGSPVGGGAVKDQFIEQML